MDQDLTNLRDHGRLLRRRWRLLTIFVILGVAAALALSFLQTPLYTAEAKLLLQNRVAPTSDSAEIMAPEEVATQAAVVLSDPVARRVIDSVGLDTNPRDLIETVTVEAVEDQRVVAITATREDAQESADVANAFAEEYVARRADQALETKATIREAYLAQLGDINLERSKLRDRLADASKARSAAIQAKVQSLLARQAALRTSLLLEDDPTAVVPSAGETLQRAQPPASPSEPKPIQAGLFGLVIGLAIGLPLAYLRGPR